MICEAYDDNGDLCSYCADGVMEVTWPHENYRATIQARLCEDHYQSFKAEMSSNPGLKTTEKEHQ
jgi:hypothetical protein